MKKRSKRALFEAAQQYEALDPMSEMLKMQARRGMEAGTPMPAAPPMPQPPRPQQPSPGFNPNQMDPMNRAMIEGSRRQTQTGLEGLTTGAAEFTGVPSMVRGGGNVMEGLEAGNMPQAARGAGEAILGALPLGSGMAMRGAGRLAGQIPGVAKYAPWAEQAPGVVGAVARTAPPTAGVVGAVEVAKGLMNVPDAIAAEAPKPPVGASAIDKQQWLLANGYDVGDKGADGKWGPSSKKAWSKATKARDQWEISQNTPEMRALANRERGAAAARAEAEAGLLAEQTATAAQKRKAAEAGRVGSVLTDAEKRRQEAPRSFGRQVTEAMQDFVGPALQTGAAVLGARGLMPKRVGSGSIDKRAQSLMKKGDDITDAERGAFVKTYDQAVKKAPIVDKTDVATYGVLGGEMALASGYMEEARAEQAAALEAFQAGVGGPKESELADRVAKANANVEKWEKLQGAGLHGMGYYTAGRLASKAIPKAQPGPDAAFARNLMDQRSPPVGQSLMERARRAAQPSQVRAPQRPVVPPNASTSVEPPIPRPTNVPVRSQGNRPGSSQAESQSGSVGRQKGRAKAFTDTPKRAISESLLTNGKITIADAKKLAPGVDDVRLTEYVTRMREAYNTMGPEAFRKALENNMLLRGMVAAPVGLIPGLMPEQIYDTP